MQNNLDPKKGIIAWFANNHIAANLLMILIIIAGLYSITSLIKIETFPPFETRTITITTPYPGAAPEESELGVTTKIEEAVKAINGIKEMRSVSAESSSRVIIDVLEEYDIRDVLDEVKTAVNGISTLPEETERPIITRSRYTNSVINISVYGDLSDLELKSLAEKIDTEVRALPSVSTTHLWGERPAEIAIEIHQSTLREYGLTLNYVAQTIRNYSLNLPAGLIRTETDDIRLRTKAQAYLGEEFGNITVLNKADGTRVLISDLATITDGFEEVSYYARFNGKPALVISVQSTAKENELAIAEEIRNYVAQRKLTLPDGATIDTWFDSSHYLKGRMELMLENMALGAFLVFIILGFFLHRVIAFWVILGIPVAFLGAMAIMPSPMVDVSINVLSLFGFILVLGIVVDDAIVIAESAYSEIKASGFSRDNIIRGVKRVSIPSTFGVLTTIAAMAPLLFFSGSISFLTKTIAAVSILCLIFSLVESKLILPAHLASMKSIRQSTVAIKEPWASRLLQKFSIKFYQPLLHLSIRHRYTTIAIFISCLILITGIISGGILRFAFFPKIDWDYIRAEFELQQGVSEATSIKVITQILQGLDDVESDLAMTKNQPNLKLVANSFAWTSDGRSGIVFVEMVRSEVRPITIFEMEDLWRARVGTVIGVKKLLFSASRSSGSSPPIALKISSYNSDELKAAATELVKFLSQYEGVYDIENSIAANAPEILLKLKPRADSLGLTLSSLASQVRQAFYGVEAQRIQRGNDELKVMVRYPKDGRSKISDLENMWVRLDNGKEIPLVSVAEINEGKSEDVIRRTNGKRSATITANVDLDITEPGSIAKSIKEKNIPKLKAKYTSLEFSLTGSSKEESEGSLTATYSFIFALFIIYALLAVPLGSYSQPIMIMSVIPFGIFGAVVGHLLLDLTISIVSLSGIIALSGVIVNDSLIMVSFINDKTANGVDKIQAAILSGSERLRPIILTSLTTFFGLAPIMLETSVQAQIVIPMAVSLGFGILFATFITLIMIPCLYVIIEDLKGSTQKLFRVSPKANANPATKQQI